jgi:hypothetical protein
MRTLAFVALAAVALCGCGGSGSGGAKTPDGALPPAPGEEAGVPGSRGGGTPLPGGGDGAAPDGALDGGSAPDARPADRAPDLARDLAADLLASPDMAPPPADGASDVCGAGGICATYEGDYVLALRRARTCDPTLKAQCALSRPTSLGCSSSCSAWVTSAVELDALRTKYTEAGCAQCKRVCPLIACQLPTMGVCRVNRGPVAAAAPDRILPPVGGLGMCFDVNDPTPVGPVTQ